MARFRLKHFLIILLLAMAASVILLWPVQSNRVHHWQRRLFSPGPISLAHQRDLKGNIMFCRACHLPGRTMSNKTCQECHDQDYYRKKRPFLADSHKILGEHDYCVRCHGEHAGLYMKLKIPGFTAQVHKTLPVPTEKCARCHQLEGRSEHPALINQNCAQCHKEYQWSSNFQHKSHLSKAPTAEKMLQMCRDCHPEGYHYTQGNRAKENCLVCHEYWGRRRKNREIPFPEGLFT